MAAKIYPDGDANFRRVGPGECVCRLCGARVSWNALARSGHLRKSKAHSEALAKAKGK